MQQVSDRGSCFTSDPNLMKTYSVGKPVISRGQIYHNITGTVESAGKEWDVWDNEQQ